VCDETARKELQAVLDAAMAPDVRCWHLGSDATWTRSGDVDHHAELMAWAGEGTA
jgi:polyphosphate kinase